MADVTYESLQSKIETQKAVIRQQKTAGERGLQSLRRVDPRVKPSVYFGEREPQIKTIRGQLVKLESAEKELSEHERVIAQRKAEGYKVRETDEGKIEFYKEVYTPGERVQVGTRPTSVMVYWINPKTGKTGRFQGRQSQMADYERQLSVTGRQVTKVTTIGGGEPIYKEKEGFWSTKDVILWEAPPIIKEPIKTAKEIETYTRFYEKIPESIVKKKLPTPVKFAEARGLPSDVFKEYMAAREVTTTTRTFTQSEIDKLLAGKTKEEKLVWYKENVRFGEEKQTWAEIKREQPDWDLKVKAGKVIVATPETDREQLLKVMGEKYGELPVPARVARAGAISYLSLFRPETWIAAFMRGGGPLTGGILGVQPRIGYEAAVSTLEWEYPITKIEKPLEKWMAVQRPAYEHVIIPFVAGAGIGKAFQIGAKLAPAYGKGAEIIARGTPWAIGGGISAMVGADIGYTAAMEEAGMVKPDTTLAKIFGYGAQFTFAGLGAHWARGVHLSKSQLQRIEQARIDFNKSMSKIPGYEPAYEQISIFKTTGKYGVLQDGVRYPSALYSGVRARMSMLRQPIDTFVARSTWLQQQRMVSKYAFKPPISMEQRYRAFAIRSPYTMTGAIRIQPRVGYALSTEAIARIAPRGGYLIRPSVEVMPKIFETTDLIFTKKVPVEGGYLLEYIQKTDIHYKPLTKRLPYEYETMKGFGRIFKPDMPGEYTIGGKKIFIGAREAYDVFAGKKVLLRTFGGRAEQLGITQAVYAESKLRIPAKLTIKAPIERIPIMKRDIPYFEKRGLPDFEKLYSTKTIQNVQQEYYNFISATKQTGLPGKTSITVGLGRTQELFTIHSPSKAFKLTVSRYFTVGDVTTIKDAPFLPKKTIPVRGAGQIYDITEWYGTDYLKTPVSSYHMRIFTQLKTIKASQIVSPAALEAAQKQFYVPSARQLPIPEPSGQVVGVKTYAAVSPYITPIVGVSPVVVKDVKPVFKQMDRTMPMMTYDERLEYAIVTTQLEKELTKLMPKQITKPMTRIEEKMITRQLERQITKPMTRQIERQITKPMTRQIERQVTKTMTKQITRLLEKQILKQITKEIMKPVITYMPPIYDSRYGLVKTPIKEIIEPPPPMPPPAFILPDTPYKMFGHTLGQGYHTYVKERHHFEGKKLKEGKMVRLSKHPLSRTDALSLGGMAIDNSAAATFEIRPVNAMAQSPLIKLKSFESFQDKFYMKDNKYIEKPKHRIDTKGEVKGISALGWYAERTTKAAKKKPVRRPRAKEVRERDMFDMGMDDMLINMDKIFKGGFDFGF